MKRHPALQELSRDHHHALVVAQRLRRAEAPDARSAAEGFLEYWRADGQEHFRQEEEILLPALARFTDPDRPIVVRVLLDHVRIRRLAAELEAAAAREGPEAQPVEMLHKLGTELEQHIRREERELFVLIEQVVPEPQLIQLAARLA